MSDKISVLEHGLYMDFLTKSLELRPLNVWSNHVLTTVEQLSEYWTDDERGVTKQQEFRYMTRTFKPKEKSRFADVDLTLPRNITALDPTTLANKYKEILDKIGKDVGLGYTLIGCSMDISNFIYDLKVTLHFLVEWDETVKLHNNG